MAFLNDLHWVPLVLESQPVDDAITRPLTGSAVDYLHTQVKPISLLTSVFADVFLII